MGTSCSVGTRNIGNSPSMNKTKLALYIPKGTLDNRNIGNSPSMNKKNKHYMYIPKRDPSCSVDTRNIENSSSMNITKLS